MQFSVTRRIYKLIIIENLERNPYIPREAANPSLPQFQQRKLSGVGLEERKEASRSVGEMIGKVSRGEAVDFQCAEIKKFYRLKFEDISRERAGTGWLLGP